MCEATSAISLSDKKTWLSNKTFIIKSKKRSNSKDGLKMSSQCSIYHYCTTSFNRAWTQVLRRFKSCLWCAKGLPWSQVEIWHKIFVDQPFCKNNCHHQINISFSSDPFTVKKGCWIKFIRISGWKYFEKKLWGYRTRDNSYYNENLEIEIMFT